MELLAIRLSPQAGKSLVIPLHGGGNVEADATIGLLAMPPLEIFHEANQLLNCRERKPVVEGSANAAGGAMPG
jgi:hypothetical protein